MNGGQRPDFGGQRPDSLQIYIFGISIPNARCMQNLGSFRPLGAILRPPVLIKRDFAVPLFVRIMEKKGLKVEMINSLKSFYDSKRSSPRTNPHDTTTALALYFRVIIIAFKGRI